MRSRKQEPARPRPVKSDAKKDLPSYQDKLKPSDPNLMYPRLDETTNLLDHGCDPFRFLKDLTNTITTKSTYLPSCKASTPGSIAATFESVSDQTSEPSPYSLNPSPMILLLSMLQDKKNAKSKNFSKTESIARNICPNPLERLERKRINLGTTRCP